MLYPEHAHYILLLISLLLISRLKETYELVKESEYSQIKYYYPLVEYSYNYNNATYTNTCVTFEKQNIWTSGYNLWGDKSPEKNKPWHSWKENTEVTVYINPKSPQQSVLLPLLTKKRLSHQLALIAAGVLIFGVWVLLKHYNITSSPQSGDLVIYQTLRVKFK